MIKLSVEIRICVEIILDKITLTTFYFTTGIHFKIEKEISDNLVINCKTKVTLLNWNTSLILDRSANTRLANLHLHLLNINMHQCRLRTVACNIKQCIILADNFLSVLQNFI